MTQSVLLSDATPLNAHESNSESINTKNIEFSLQDQISQKENPEEGLRGFARIQQLQEQLKNKELSSLEKIKISQEQLSSLKESLSTIIDSIASNPSLFTRAATTWGEIPLWQKIIGGGVVTIPTLAIGIFAHVGVLIVLSGASGLVYTTSSIILDDHHSCNTNIKERLKQGIFNLADVLTLTINALDSIREKFSEEIQKLKSENLKLEANINELKDQIFRLSNQVELLMAAERLLRTTQEDLERSAQELKEKVGENAELLTKVQKELEQVKKDSMTNQRQLNEKVLELNQVNSSLNLELNKAKHIGTTLQNTITMLTGTVIGKPDDKERFNKQLTNLLENEKSSFLEINDELIKTKQELQQVLEELKKIKEQNEELLKNHEDKIMRMENLVQQGMNQQIQKQNTCVENLEQFGTFKRPRVVDCRNQDDKENTTGFIH